MSDTPGTDGDIPVGGGAEREATAEGSGEQSSERYTFEDLSVVMGTYNEAEAIGAVLSDIETVTDG